MHKELFENIGLLNEELHYMLDTEFWWRLYKAGYKFKRLKNYTWGLRIHKDAKMSSHMFTSSETINKKHPVWQKRRDERSYLSNNYLRSINISKKIIGKFLVNFTRIFSFEYLKSILFSYFFKDKPYVVLTKNK